MWMPSRSRPQGPGSIRLGSRVPGPCGDHVARTVTTRVDALSSGSALCVNTNGCHLTSPVMVGDCCVAVDGMTATNAFAPAPVFELAVLSPPVLLLQCEVPARRTDIVVSRSGRTARGGAPRRTPAHARRLLLPDVHLQTSCFQSGHGCSAPTHEGPVRRRSSLWDLHLQIGEP